MAKTQLQIETEAHYAAWLAQRRQAVAQDGTQRLEAIFAKVDRLGHLRFEYMAGMVDEAEVAAALRRALEELHEAI